MLQSYFIGRHGVKKSKWVIAAYVICIGSILDVFVSLSFGCGEVRNITCYSMISLCFEICTLARITLSQVNSYISQGATKVKLTNDNPTDVPKETFMI